MSTQVGFPNLDSGYDRSPFVEFPPGVDRRTLGPPVTDPVCSWAPLSVLGNSRHLKAQTRGAFPNTRPPLVRPWLKCFLGWILASLAFLGWILGTLGTLKRKHEAPSRTHARP